MNSSTLVIEKTATESTTQVHYIKGENSITFKTPKGLEIVTSDMPHFEVISEAIQNDPSILNVPKERLIASITEKGYVDKAHRFWLNGTLFEKGAGDLVLRAQEAGLSLEPVMAFIEKARQSEFPDQLIKLVAKNEIEITWTGDMVLYARAAWGLKKIDATWIEESQVEPGRKISQPTVTGTFQYATTQCPDQGVVFEILVEPSKITGISEQIRVSEYTVLSRLSEGTKSENHGISLVYRNTTNTGALLVRTPYNMETARAYLQNCLQGGVTKNLEGTQLTGSC
jgi:hypothetical protein